MCIRDRLRAGSQRVVDEVERSVHDSLMVVRDVMELPSVEAGGGAPETFAATKIRSWAKSLQGREQLAAEKFAEALEAIPLALSENAGMDPIDTLTHLRAKQIKGEKWTGIDVMKGKVGNLKSTDIIEPLAVKHQIVSAATEAACMILRIDDAEPKSFSNKSSRLVTILAPVAFASLDKSLSFTRLTARIPAYDK